FSQCLCVFVPAHLKTHTHTHTHTLTHTHDEKDRLIHKVNIKRDTPSAHTVCSAHTHLTHTRSLTLLGTPPGQCWGHRSGHCSQRWLAPAPSQGSPVGHRREVTN